MRMACSEDSSDHRRWMAERVIYWEGRKLKDQGRPLDRTDVVWIMREQEQKQRNQDRLFAYHDRVQENRR